MIKDQFTKENVHFFEHMDPMDIFFLHMAQYNK